MWNLRQLRNTLTYLMIFSAIFTFGYVLQRLPKTKTVLHYQRAIQDQPSIPPYTRTPLTGSYTTERTTQTDSEADSKTSTVIETFPAVNVFNISRNALKQTDTMATTKGTESPAELGKNDATFVITPALSEKIITATPRSSANYSGNSESYPTFITGTPIGGLGNQLFIYASIVGLAAHYNATPFIKPHHGIVKMFKIPHVNNITVLNARKIRTSCCKFVTLPDVEGRQNWTISGYAQSWKFFANVSKTLRRSLQIRERILKDARHFLASWTKNGSTLVGIHVRRGNFLTARIGGRSVPGPGYIKRAQDFFRNQFSNVQFVVVSNDHKWCQANVTGSDVVHSSFTNPMSDLALLALCDHVIMTVGTFGWWGAWLANGIVVYYKDYPQPGSELFRITVNEDHFMPNWIAMS